MAPFGRSPMRFDPRGFDYQQPQRNIFSYGAQEQAPTAPISRPPLGDLGGFRNMNFAPVPSEESPVIPGSQFSMDLTPPPEQEESNGLDVFSKANRPDFGSVKKFIDLAQSQPDRANYKPNIWQNILGAVAGGSAGMLGASPDQIQGQVESVRYSPYNRAMGDWATKTGAYGKAAEAEIKTEEVGNRWLTMLTNAYDKQSLAERRDAQTAYDTARTGQAQQRIDLDKQKQQDAVKKAEDEGWDTIKAGGRVYAYNPITEEQRDLGVDRGVEIAAERAAIAKTVAETGQANARTRAREAGTSERRATTGERLATVAEAREERSGPLTTAQINNINARTNHVTWQERQATGMETRVERDMTPKEKADIHNSAMTAVLTANPEYRDFFDAKGQLDSSWAGDPLYEEYKVKLNQEINKQLGSGKIRTTTTKTPVGSSGITPPATPSIIDYNSLSGGTPAAKPTTPWWKPPGS